MASSPPCDTGPAILAFGGFGGRGFGATKDFLAGGAYVNSGNGTAMSRSCCSSNAESISAFSADGISGTECDIKRLLESSDDDCREKFATAKWNWIMCESDE